MIGDGFYIHTTQYDKFRRIGKYRDCCTFRIRSDYTVANRGYDIREK